MGVLCLFLELPKPNFAPIMPFLPKRLVFPPYLVEIPQITNKTKCHRILQKSAFATAPTHPPGEGLRPAGQRGNASLAAFVEDLLPFTERNLSTFRGEGLGEPESGKDCRVRRDTFILRRAKRCRVARRGGAHRRAGGLEGFTPPHH